MDGAWIKRIIKRYCRVTEGNSRGSLIQVMPWQSDFFDKITGYKDVWLELPRKNGKSATIAMLAIAHMIDGFKHDKNPEVILAASTKEQAGILFRYVKNMILADPRLLQVFRPQQYEIKLRGKPGYIKTVASDGRSNHGYNPSLILCDEIHAWSETKGPELWEALETSRGFRGAQMISITTAGKAYSWAWGRHEYARRVAAGEVQDPNMLALIYSAPEDAEPLDEQSWIQANPSYHYLPGLKEHLEAEKIKALHDPLKLVSFKKLYLNQWIGSQDGWLDFFAWQKCKAEEPEDLSSWHCVLGVDFASNIDFNAFTILWWKKGKFYSKQEYMICQSGMERRKNQYPALAGQWINQGFIKVIPGEVVGKEDKIQFIQELYEKYNPVKIFFDPWNALEIAVRLEQIYGGERCMEIPQRAEYVSEPMKDLESLVISGEFKHDGNPVTAWMIGNVIKREDRWDNWTLDKAASPEKIDGPASLVCALAGYKKERMWNYGELAMGFV